MILIEVFKGFSLPGSGSPFGLAGELQKEGCLGIQTNLILTQLKEDKTMHLIKYDNFYKDPLADLDQWMGRFFEAAPLWDANNRRGQGPVTGGFRLDTFADDEGYHAVAELPGVPKEAIDVRLENAVLTISGERTTGEGESRRTFKFSRSITLGDDVNPDAVTARYEDGLLTVDLPKAEERKPRAISVQ